MEPLPPSSQGVVTLERLKAVERVMTLQYMPPAKKYRILADMFEDFELQDLGYAVDTFLLKRHEASDVQKPQVDGATQKTAEETVPSKLEIIQIAKAAALAKRKAKQEQEQIKEENLRVAQTMEWLPP